MPADGDTEALGDGFIVEVSDSMEEFDENGMVIVAGLLGPGVRPSGRRAGEHFRHETGDQENHLLFSSLLIPCLF